MGVLAKRTGEPIGSFEELAASAEHKACKRKNEREGEERAAINLMTLYDLPTLKAMLAVSDKRTDWVVSAVLLLAAAAILLPLFWWVLTQDTLPTPCLAADGFLVLLAFLLCRLRSIQWDREQLIKRAIWMHEEEELERALEDGGKR